jgi:hypothetical protein
MTLPTVTPPIEIELTGETLWLFAVNKQQEHVNVSAARALNDHDLRAVGFVPLVELELSRDRVRELTEANVQLLEEKKSLEETLVIADNMRNWYRKQMGPDGPEVAYDNARKAADVTTSGWSVMVPKHPDETFLRRPRAGEVLAAPKSLAVERAELLAALDVAIIHLEDRKGDPVTLQAIRSIRRALE